MLRLSKKADYALMAMKHLAMRPDAPSASARARAKSEQPTTTSRAVISRSIPPTMRAAAHAGRTSDRARIPAAVNTPIAKNSTALGDEEQPLGDRTNLVFQNTQVTRGSAELVVVATGQSTQMGQIANMVTATKRTKSPLQIELDGLTKIFGFLAWGAVAIIAIIGIARDQDTETLILLCVSTAISAIPTGLPTFVQLMLSSGAQRLAESKAVVKSLNDVETLGGTTVINSDKTGTLTMNAMTATTMLVGGTSRCSSEQSITSTPQHLRSRNEHSSSTSGPAARPRRSVSEISGSRSRRTE